MECREVRALVDAYLDDELLVETNQAVLAHLSHCGACRAEMAARQALRTKLKNAVESDQRLGSRPDFSRELRNRLHSIDPHATSAWQRRLPWMAAATVVALLAIAWALAASWSTPRLANDPTVASLIESAVGDHRDCALRHQPSEPPISLDQAAAHDAALRGLDRAVTAPTGSLPAPLDSIAAHACVWKGRRFGHVVLSYKGVTTSVLVTAPERDTQPYALGLPEACPTTSEFAVACFAAPQHAVFIVSELSSGDTVTLAQVLAPGMRDHFTRVLAALQALFVSDVRF